MKKRFLKKRMAVLVAVMLLVCSVSAHAAVMVEIDYGSTTISPDCGGDVYVSYSVRYAGATHSASVTGWSYSLDTYSLGVQHGFIPSSVQVTSEYATYFLVSASGGTWFVETIEPYEIWPDVNYETTHSHSKTVIY